MILGLDIETCSGQPIQVGPDAYAQHESTSVHCAVLVLNRSDSCVDVANVFHWTPGLHLPSWAVEHLRAGRPVLAHNVSFELSIVQHILSPLWGWPEIPAAAWRDSAACAAAMALPTTLGGLGTALGAKEQKDTEGQKLMLSLCKAVYADGEWVSPQPTPAELLRLIDYCKTDVLASLACWFRLRARDWELELQRVDRKVNSRGVLLDLNLAERMRVAAQERTRAIRYEAAAVSEQELLSFSSMKAIKQWLEIAGVELPEKRRANGSKSATVDREATAKIMAVQDLPAVVIRVLELRQEISRAMSLAKLNRIPRMVSSDGRLRWSLRYCGAHTGRWTSTGLQVHNLAKPPKGWMAETGDRLVELLQTVPVPAEAQRICPNLVEGLSFLLRAVICAPAGRDLIGGDFAQVEARVVAWLAGQQNVLEALADPTRDLYQEDAAAVGSTSRDLGKRARLALAFGMGPVKFAATAKTHGNLTLPLKEASRVQKLWRLANPKICTFWLDLERAAHIIAGSQTAMRIPVGRLVLTGSQRCLGIVLPSGRIIYYWSPRLRLRTRMVEVVDDAGKLVEKEVTETELCYTQDAKDRMHLRVEGTYGGKLCENVTQAVARDLLGEALVRLDATIYRDIVVHVHDSITCEIDKHKGSREEFAAIMGAPTQWSDGLPIAVDTYRSERYRG